MSALPTPRACALPGTPLAHAAAGLDACVHCGFCLQACPTYVNLEDENDSPRGRIVLMRRMLEGEIALDDPDVGRHIDRCLGCRACETACPSGVPYGHLLEATRATTAARRRTPLVGAIVLAIFARRPLLSATLLGARLFRATGLPRVLAGVLPRRFAFPMAMLASTVPVRIRSTRSAQTPSSAPSSAETTTPNSATHANGTTGAVAAHARPAVALLEGCVMRGLFAHTNSATGRVLEKNGYVLRTVAGQQCCGALHAHAGKLDETRALARQNVAAFEQFDGLIAINSAGCGAMVKEYAALLEDDPAWRDRARAVSARARDVSELLAAPALGAPASGAPASGAPAPRVGAPVHARVTYDAPCHLMHAQRITREPLTVLSSIPQLTLVPLVDTDQCCGSAGIYNLIEPDTSDAVLAPKLARIAETRAELVATGNPGCLMQIGAGLMLAGSSARAVHPVHLLDASYTAQN